MDLPEPRYYLKVWSLPESLLSHTYQSSEKSSGCEKTVNDRCSSIPILDNLFSQSAALSWHSQGMDQTWGDGRVQVHNLLGDTGWTQPLPCTSDSGESTDLSVKVYFWCLDAESWVRYNILNIIYTFLRS